MKPGHESQTSVMVCTWRAVAHGNSSEARFSDPTALPLLPEKARARVERLRAGKPSGLRERLRAALIDNQAKVMVARTVAIDESIRAADSPQLVILGAGLDGRAFRMAELREVVVFEVDHPDTQREKRARAAALPPCAKDVRFVPVDFTRDSLDDALAAAGHDATRATRWIWEGVVMYLTPAEIEAALSVIARRSATGSRLIIVYHSPAIFLWLFEFFVRRLGEPLRSAFTPVAMRALLAKYGFQVVADDDLTTIGQTMPADIARITRHTKHLRIVTAERRP